jgi:hypothetical protein
MVDFPAACIPVMRMMAWGGADVTGGSPALIDGCVGGELEQGGEACLAGLDAKVFEAFPEVGDADRAAGSASGKQPG